MTTVPVELRELLEALSSEFWDDDLQAAQAKARTLLAEQPQAGAGKVYACPRCGTGMEVDASAKASARHDQRDEVRRLREALDCDRAYRNGLQAGYSFGACGDEEGYQRSLRSYQREIHAAITQSPKGEEE